METVPFLSVLLLSVQCVFMYFINLFPTREFINLYAWITLRCAFNLTEIGYMVLGNNVDFVEQSIPMRHLANIMSFLKTSSHIV